MVTAVVGAGIGITRETLCYLFSFRSLFPKMEPNKTIFRLAVDSRRFFRQTLLI